MSLWSGEYAVHALARSAQNLLFRLNRLCALQYGQAFAAQIPGDRQESRNKARLRPKEHPGVGLHRKADQMVTADEAGLESLEAGLQRLPGIDIGGRGELLRDGG